MITGIPTPKDWLLDPESVPEPYKSQFEAAFLGGQIEALESRVMTSSMSPELLAEYRYSIDRYKVKLEALQPTA